MSALVSSFVATVLTGLLVMLLAHPAAATSTTFDFNYEFTIGFVVVDQIGYQQFFGGTAGVFPQFDDQGGSQILQQVTLDLNMTIFGSVVYADGRAGEYPGYFHPMFDGLAQADFLSVALLDADFFPTPGGTALPLPFAVTGMGTDAAGLPTDLSPFIGPGMVSVFVQAGVNIPFTMPEITLGPTVAFGTASLTYVSRPIPEPNSAVLFGMGLLVVAGGLRRRQLAPPLGRQ